MPQRPDEDVLKLLDRPSVAGASRCAIAAKVDGADAEAGLTALASQLGHLRVVPEAGLEVVRDADISDRIGFCGVSVIPHNRVEVSSFEIVAIIQDNIAIFGEPRRCRPRHGDWLE